MMNGRRGFALQLFSKNVQKVQSARSVMEEESLGFLAATYELRSFNVGGGIRVATVCNLNLPAFSRRTREILFACIACGRDKFMVTHGNEIQLKYHLKTSIISYLFGTIVSR
jgi:hypothetical protein